MSKSNKYKIKKSRKPVKKSGKSKSGKKYSSTTKKVYQRPSEETFERLADFHVHSVGSADGYHEIGTLVNRAKNFNIDYLSITDHNNFNETLKFLNREQSDLRLAMHDVDGVNFVPGVEITCRVEDVKNFKGNDLKIHLLVYSPLLTENSPLVKLMDIKHGNDLAVDFGMLLNIAKLKGIQLDMQSVRDFIIHKRQHGDSGFSSFGKDDVMEYFKKEKITVAKSMRKYDRLFDSIPRAERLNLSASDVIDIVHASGGICVMAHPKLHLNRTSNRRGAVESLLEYGIDGFELMSTSMDNDTFGIITSICDRFPLKNPIIYTGGSDFHVYSEYSKMGRFGGLPLTIKSQEGLIKEIHTLNKARSQKSTTHRKYRQVLKSDIDDMIARYSDKAHQINEIYSEAQQKILDTYDDRDDFSHTTISYIDYLKEHGVYDEDMSPDDHT